MQADMRKQHYAPLLMAPMIARQRAMGPSGGPGSGQWLPSGGQPERVRRRQRGTYSPRH